MTILTVLAGHQESDGSVRVQLYVHQLTFCTDLETMEVRLEANHYEDLPSFLKDAQYIFDNCRSYNSETRSVSAYCRAFMLMTRAAITRRTQLDWRSISRYVSVF